MGPTSISYAHWIESERKKLMWRNLYLHRKMLWEFVARDLKCRYAGTMMGLFWTLLFPLLQILIFVFVFALILSNKFSVDSKEIPYWIYLCSGLIPWIAFQDACTRSAFTYMENANLIKKVFFPAEILPAYITVAGVLNLLISLLIFLVILAVTGNLTGIVLLFLPVLIFLQGLMIFGFSLCFSILTVFFRDFGQFIQVLFMLWFWGTPICYPQELVQQAEVLPLWAKVLVQANPFYALVNLYRDILMVGKIPDWRQLVWFLAFSLGVYLVGKILFRTQMKEIVDVV